MASTCESYTSIRFSDVFLGSSYLKQGLKKKTNAESGAKSVTKVLHPKSSADHKPSRLPLQKRLEILFFVQRRRT